ncbi:MAG: hypothetical protein EOO01_20680 [Chitinophagaceae bacterium]|nr:MAG: hypothetical protein EOO01_20680 [Chitinophagaceae bacterium]
MKKLVFLASLIILILSACNDGDGSPDSQDTVTGALRNADADEQNAYNLPGSDTGAIHQNTTEPGVLDMDAGDTSQQLSR